METHLSWAWAVWTLNVAGRREFWRENADKKSISCEHVKIPKLSHRHENRRALVRSRYWRSVLCAGFDCDAATARLDSLAFSLSFLLATIMKMPLMFKCCHVDVATRGLHWSAQAHTRMHACIGMRERLRVCVCVCVHCNASLSLA